MRLGHSSESLSSDYRPSNRRLTQPVASTSTAPPITSAQSKSKLISKSKSNENDVHGTSATNARGVQSCARPLASEPIAGNTESVGLKPYAAGQRAENNPEIVSREMIVHRSGRSALEPKGGSNTGKRAAVNEARESDSSSDHPNSVRIAPSAAPQAHTSSPQAVDRNSAMKPKHSDAEGTRHSHSARAAPDSSRHPAGVNAARRSAPQANNKQQLSPKQRIGAHVESDLLTAANGREQTALKVASRRAANAGAHAGERDAADLGQQPSDVTAANDSICKMDNELATQ